MELSPLEEMSWKACTLPWLIASCCWKVFVAPGSLLMTAAVSDRCHLAKSSPALVIGTEKMHSWTPLVVSLPSLMFLYSSEITVAAYFLQFMFSCKEKLTFSFISLIFSTIITWQKRVLEKSKELLVFFLAGPKWPLVPTAFEITGVCLAWKITAIGEVMLHWSIFKRNSRILKIETLGFFFLTLASPTQVCWCNFQSTKKCLRTHLSQVSQI